MLNFIFPVLSVTISIVYMQRKGLAKPGCAGLTSELYLVLPRGGKKLFGPGYTRIICKSDILRLKLPSLYLGFVRVMRDLPFPAR